MIRTLMRPLLISPLIQQAARGLVQVLDTKSHAVHDVEDLPPLLLSKLPTKQSDLSQQTPAKVHLVLEFFNFGQQKILDHYTQAVREGMQMNDGEIVYLSLIHYLIVKKQKALEEFEKEYQKSIEGFNLDHYSNLLDLATELDFDVQSGFINRDIARMMLSKEKEEVLQVASQHIENVQHVYYEDSIDHLRHFVSLMTGQEDMTDEQLKELPDRMKRLFQAQCLKDSSMADKIHKLATSDSASHNIVLAIAGSNHFEYGLGVPERVKRLFASTTNSDNSNQNAVEVESVLITCKDSTERELVENETKYLSDFVYFVDLPQDDDETPAQHFHATQSSTAPQ